MTWVEDQINKEDIFPTTPGEINAYFELCRNPLRTVTRNRGAAYIVGARNVGFGLLLLGREDATPWAKGDVCKRKARAKFPLCPRSD